MKTIILILASQPQSHGQTLLFVALFVGLVALVAWRLLKPESEKPKPPKHVLGDIDLSGSMLGKNGMLLDGNRILHRTHGPEFPLARLKNKLGILVEVGIARREDLGGDVRILHLAEPLDLRTFNVIPIGKARVGPVTIIRANRSPLHTKITAILTPHGGRVLHAPLNFEPTDEANDTKTGTNDLRNGDSGKVWLQDHEGEIKVVGITHRADINQSPDLSYYAPIIQIS